VSASRKPVCVSISWKKVVKENKPLKISKKEYSRISVILDLELYLFFALLLSASFMANGPGIYNEDRASKKPYLLIHE